MADFKSINNQLEKLIVANCNAGLLVECLKQIGQIDDRINAQLLKTLVSHKSAQVRQLAIKNLAKIKDKSNIEIFTSTYHNDCDTSVRREAISAIGRYRLAEHQDFLIQVLSDEDPKIVCQAIRALLVFKGTPEIDLELKQLITHENEMIRQVIEKEYFPKRTFDSKNHATVDKRLLNTVVLGDVLETLKIITDECIHLTFTSPPYYNARDYSIYPSYDSYLGFLEEVFKQTYRVTKEGRFLVVNTSPIIIPRVSRAHSSKRYPIPFDLHAILVKMGWEFIDDIIWEKPEYSVKNRIGGFQQHRKPLAYKPNSVTEYLMVYRKKTDKLIDWNIHQYNSKIVNESKVNNFETTNIWKIHPKSSKVHSAIFPVELCERIIQYYSFKGDLVFDPFAGIGTLGRTAKMLGRSFFMTEIEIKFFEYMQSLVSKNTLHESNPTRFLTLEKFKEQYNDINQ